MKDLMFESWINAQAANYATCDQIISEKLKTLDENDVIKRSAYTGFIDNWVTKEVTEADEEAGTEASTNYVMKPCPLMRISRPGKYKIDICRSRDGSCPVDLEKVVDNPKNYLKNILTSASQWEQFCSNVKFEKPVGCAIGCLLEDFCGVVNDEGAKDPLGDAQNVIQKTFDYIKNYDAQGFTQFIHENNIQIDDRKGVIYFEPEVLGTEFGITLFPSEK